MNCAPSSFSVWGSVVGPQESFLYLEFSPGVCTSWPFKGMWGRLLALLFWNVRTRRTIFICSFNHSTNVYKVLIMCHCVSVRVWGDLTWRLGFRYWVIHIANNATFFFCLYSLLKVSFLDGQHKIL